MLREHSQRFCLEGSGTDAAVRLCRPSDRPPPSASADGEAADGAPRARALKAKGKWRRCYFFNTEHGCRYGVNCAFRHQP